MLKLWLLSTHMFCNSERSNKKKKIHTKKKNIHQVIFVHLHTSCSLSSPFSPLLPPAVAERESGPCGALSAAMPESTPNSTIMMIAAKKKNCGELLGPFSAADCSTKGVEGGKEGTGWRLPVGPHQQQPVSTANPQRLWTLWTLTV